MKVNILGSYKLLSLILTAIFIVSLGWYLNKSQDLPSESDKYIADATPTLGFTGREGWETQSTNNFSFMYPTEAKAEGRESESIVVYMGQKQIDSGRTQTELFDGYSFRVGRFEQTDNQSLKEAAESDRNNAEVGCEGYDGTVSELVEVAVADTLGYQYSSKGCYIDYTNTFVENSEIIYLVSQSYVGDKDDQDKYKEITNQILSTLTFVK